MNLESGENAGHADFPEETERIVHRICRDAIWAADACNWLEWRMGQGGAGGEHAFATLGADLYTGTSGISLFLARYVMFRPSRRVEAVLRGALEHALCGLARLPQGQVGLFDGAAGICLAAIEAGAALDDTRLVERGLGQLSVIANDEPEPMLLDVIDGSAGLILVQLVAAQRFKREALLASAIRHGDHLLACADKSDEGWSWPTAPEFAERNLTGYAHGVAGIATALLELHMQTGQARFLEAARQGWRYERTHFCHAQNNWPDFRPLETGENGPEPSGPQCSTAWCHGAVGIGLSRLRAWELGYHDAELAAEIEAALTSTRAWLETHNHPRTEFSLCHGRAGNAELFIAAARILNRPDLYDVAADVGQSGIEQFRLAGRPWACGGTTVGETPNLMLGLAGIGMFYLRLQAAERIETALLIRPAPRTQDHSPDVAPRQ